MDALVGEARLLLQPTIAAQLRIPVDYLRRRWGDDYNPARDLFSTKRGYFEPIWALDIDMWEAVGKAYAAWTLVPPNKVFWKHLHDILIDTVEWWGSDHDFQQWMRASAGIRP